MVRAAADAGLQRPERDAGALRIPEPLRRDALVLLRRGHSLDSLDALRSAAVPRHPAVVGAGLPGLSGTVLRPLCVAGSANCSIGWGI